MFPLPGVAGMFFAAMLVLNTAVLLRPEGRYRGRYILTALPIVFGLMASGQRAALLGCGFAMLVLAILTRSRRLVGVLLLATAALVASAVIGVGPSRVTSGVAGNNAHSTQTRFKTWTSVAEQLPTFPFGHGPGYTGSSAYRFGSRVGATPRVVSDNYWVKQLWEMGILGALWYTAVLALAALAALRLFRAARPESGAVALAVCGLIAPAGIGLVVHQRARPVALQPDLLAVRGPGPDALPGGRGRGRGVRAGLGAGAGPATAAERRRLSA